MYRKRLKNVYELLEAGNNRKVIQEVDKLIASSSTSAGGNKKRAAAPTSAGDSGYDEQATLVIGKALKSLALVRTNRKPEADRLIDELLQTNTTDENALNIVMQYCKETQQLSKIVSFYENAVNECQQNAALVGTSEHEEIQNTLFYAYVRNCDFAKQQQIALKLYKQTNRMMYCYWNAASYVMMAKAGSGSGFGPASGQAAAVAAPTPQQSMYLQLAEKILQKAYDDQKMEWNGEFLLFLAILEERGKLDEALRIVEAFNEEENLSKVGVTDFKVKKKLEYLKKLKRWSELAELCESYLGMASNANLDNWLVYLDYIDAIVARLEAKQPSASSAADLLNDELISAGLAFLDGLKGRVESAGSENGGTKAQGPYLARIELLSRLVQLKTQKTEETEVKDERVLEKLKLFFEQYIGMFASKPGIFYDLIYFKHLYQTPALRATVLGCLKRLHDEQRPFKDVKSVYTCLAYWQMHRYFGEQAKLGKSELEALVAEMEKMYVEALEFGKDMLPTSFQYADDFIILASHLRYDIYRKFTHSSTASPKDLFQIVYNLKHALTHSPSNYQLKLLLLNLYSKIGAYDALHQMYQSMEIKNIQNYSTSNLLLFHNIRLGALSQATYTYGTMDQFFNSNQFDMVNFLVNCYKYGTFMKAVEICSFMHTIKHSLSISLCLTNHMSLMFIFHSTNLTAAPASSGAGFELVYSGNAASDDDQAIAADFRLLQTRLEKHLKELANVSSAHDPKSGLLPDEEARLAEALLDHHDKDVVAQWDPEDEAALAKRQYDAVINEQRRLLRLRSLMVRFTDAILRGWLATEEADTAPTVSDEDRAKLDVYKQKLVDFDYRLPAGADDELSSVYVTQSSYLKRIGELKLDSAVRTIVHLAGELCSHSDHKFLQAEQENGQKTLQQARATLQECFETVKSKVQTVLVDLDKAKAPAIRVERLTALLEYYTSSLEMLAFVVNTFAVLVSSKSMKQMWSEKTKKIKSKKKGLYPQYAQSVDVLFEIYEIICSILRHLYAELKQTICANVAGCVTAQFEGVRQVLACSAPNSAGYLDDIAQSYVKSFEDMKQLYGAKLRYILKFSGNVSNLAPNLASILEILKL